MQLKRRIKISKYGIIFRNNTKYILVFLLAVVLSFSCSSDTVSEEPEIALKPLKFESFVNVPYGDDSEQVYDIYLPANRSTDTKLLLLVHGGGWSSGDKTDMNAFKDFVIDQLPEVAVVNMNYRLANENKLPYPMQTDDITNLVNTLKEKRNEYQVGSDLGFMGVSAGAHLALLWSYALDRDKNVSMVCSVVGPTNLLDPAYQNSDDETVQALIEQFGQENQILEEASPLQQLTADAPPTILFYGGQDPLIPVSQGVDLDAKLTDLGVAHEFTLYESEGHGWIGLNLLDTSVKLKAFIEMHLLK